MWTASRIIPTVVIAALALVPVLDVSVVIASQCRYRARIYPESPCASNRLWDVHARYSGNLLDLTVMLNETAYELGGPAQFCDGTRADLCELARVVRADGIAKVVESIIFALTVSCACIAASVKFALRRAVLFACAFISMICAFVGTYSLSDLIGFARSVRDGEKLTADGVFIFALVVEVAEFVASVACIIAIAYEHFRDAKNTQSTRDVQMQ